MKRLIVLVVTAGAFACSNPQEEAELLIDAMVESAEAGGEALADTSGWQGKLNTLQAAANSADQDSLWARYQMVSADVQASVPGGAL
jgi:hypothetical protein